MMSLATYLQLITVIVALYFLHCAKSLTHDITLNLDAGDDGRNKECGAVLNLMAGNETTVTASGKVPSGDCKVSFRPISNKKYKCNQLCVTLRNKKMETCDVQIRFTAIYFSKKPDENRKFDCWNRFKDAWCPMADILQVNIVENNEYLLLHALNNKKRLYEFVADISPVCVAIKTGEITADKIYYSSKTRQLTEERERKTRIEGVVVAVCLSSIFLVVLFVFYCYYKSKATDGPPDPNTEYTKVSAFTGFRTKFLPKKKKRNLRKRHEEPELLSHSPRQTTSQDYIAPDNPQKVSTSSVDSPPSGDKNKRITDSTATLEIGNEVESKPLVAGQDIPDGNDS